MPGKNSPTRSSSSIEAELYFLIAKFLESGPCHKSAEVLRNEIENFKLMPKRLDWLGNEHDRTFSDLERSCPHISPNHLLKICSNIGPVLDREIPPNVAGIQSLLGAGRQSLLRKKEDFQKPSITLRSLSTQRHGIPIQPPLSSQNGYPPNITQVLVAREQTGFSRRSHTLSTKFYGRQQMYRRLLGHLSSVYCVMFDRTGQYIFTGADDLLVKIWSAKDGRLLSTLRGHSAEITDMAINYENTLLAAGSCDKIIRVWCVKSLAPVAVLVGHTGIVTSLQFCPYARGDKRYLISTGNDGCVCFWQWSIRSTSFNPKPLKFTERNRAGAQMVCSSFSPGGIFLATGSTDHHVRVYNILGVNGPEKICELELHTDRVDSLQFSSNSCRFITGSKDGTAMIWEYTRQKWSTIPLKMSSKLPGAPTEGDDETKQKLKVTMVGWSSDDSVVFTAVNDHSIKVWDSYTGHLIHVLVGHEDEIFVLEANPADPRILLSGGHDGRIILWDAIAGIIIKSFFNVIEGQGHGAVFDCKFSPDGMIFASTDSHGHLSIFGFGTNENYKKVPEEQYFHTDYRPLIRDSNHHVLDEQTQCAPHLMPPPFLVDIDGNPYPPHLQRLVPGRENCLDSQLVPYIAVFADGDTEILEPVRAQDGDNHRPTIDDMIVRLQQEQGAIPPPQGSVSPRENGIAAAASANGNNSERGPLSPRPSGHRLQSGHSPGHSRVGMRRDGDIEGVRQSLGNWQSRGGGVQAETPVWMKRLVVKTFNPASLKQNQLRRQILGDQELAHYNREKKKRAIQESRELSHMYKKSAEQSKQRKKKTEPDRRRSKRNTGPKTNGRSHVFGEDYEDPDEISLSTTDSSTSPDNGEPWDDSSENSESDSGDYSDWTAEAGVSIESSPKPHRSSYRKKGRSSEEEERSRTENEGHRQRSRREARKAAQSRSSNGIPNELPPEYRPPEWLTGVVPHRAPYVPQIGDEVVYFRQGHQLYAQAVKRSKAYDINMKNQPWKLLNLREQEILKITNINYEICPPRLCCLTVSIIDPSSEQSNTDEFVIRYHDMPDVIDFMVLRQVYSQAVAHNWKAGDRFRSLIDNAWWLGRIEEQTPLHVDFPDSMFQCFSCLWDNGEIEKMSPWDFDPVDEERFPTVIGGSVEVTREEQLSMMYVPDDDEWPRHGRDEETERLVKGIDIVMKLPFGKLFASPVDLNVYPNYAMIIEFPVDLSMIKARLQNRYYRRLAAVKFDIQFIEQNAKKFNEPRCEIIKQARLVNEILQSYILDCKCDDIMELYTQIMEHRQSRSTESDSEATTSGGGSYAAEEMAERRSSRKRSRNSIENQNKRRRLETQQYTSSSWKEHCLSFLELIVECEDSTPFRNPVSLIDYPDYRDIIDHPMDLSTVKEKLQTSQYRSPVEFCKDMRLIFQNSRNYNTNKKSRIYSMTIRLSAMFEEQIRGVISDWRSAVKYEEKLKNNQYVSNRRRPVVGADTFPLSKKKKPGWSPNSKNVSKRNGQSSRSQRNGRPTSSHHNGATSSSRSRKSLLLKSTLRHTGSNISRRRTNHRVVAQLSDSSAASSSSRVFRNGIVPKKKKPTSSEAESQDDLRNKVKRSTSSQIELKKRIRRAISMTNGGIRHTARRRRTVVNYRELDEGIDPEELEDDDPYVHLKKPRSYHKRTESETEVSSSGSGVGGSGSGRSPKLKTTLTVKRKGKDYSSQVKHETRFSLRNNNSRNPTGSSESSSSSSHSDAEKTEVSEASNSSVDNLASRKSTRLRSVPEKRPRSSASSVTSSSLNNSDSKISSNSESFSDEDGNTRRSSRTSTQNNTRATRSALHPNMIRVELKPPSKLGRMQTRNRGQRTVLYQEDSDYEYEERNGGGAEGAAMEGSSGASTGENDNNEDIIIRKRKGSKRARVIFSE